MVALVLAQIFDPFLHDLSLPINHILLLTVCVLFVSVVSAITIKVMISRWTPQTEEDDNDSLAKAGFYIGILERLFIFGFIVINQWEAIGFLLAAKSVFRFGDLKESGERKLTEYILIGTLSSFGFAIGCGIVYKQLLVHLPG